MASKPNPFLTYLADGDPAKLPRRPPGKGMRALDVPTFNWFNWETLNVVQQAISNLEFGIIREAALLWDWMLRDDRVNTALSKRFEGLLGLEMDFDPADDTKKADRIAQDLKCDFWHMFPKAALSEMLRWGNGLGVGLSQLVYDKRRDGSYDERIQVWHPQFLYWDWTARLYYVVTQNQGNVYIEPDDPQWFLFTPYGMQLGWQKGLIRALFMPWIIRQYALRDWGRFSEIHGKPIRKAKFPSEASREEKDDFFNALTYISSETVIRLPQSLDGKTNYDLELLEAKSESWQGIKELKKDMDDCISITVLGNNLTTDQKSGSLAATKQHAQQQSIFVKGDGTNLSTFLHEGPVRYWSGWNYPGGEKIAPWARWQTDPPEDLVEKSQVTLSASQSLQILKTIGAPIDERKFLEGFSIELLEPGEEPPALPMLEEPSMESDEQPVPAALATLAADIVGASKQHKAQVYIEKMGELSTTAGAKALKRDLEAVLDAVRKAKSPTDLRMKLRARYRGMDAAAFAKIVDGALKLSALVGRGASRR